MQPLQPNAQSSVDADSHQRDNSSEESSLIQDDFGRQRASGADSIDDQSNMLSRKTSTASECTTVSDYTPENTVTSNFNAASPPTASMMQNALIDSAAASEAAFQVHGEGQPAMSSLEGDNFAAQPASSGQVNVPALKDVEAAPPNDRPPQERKISRFRVSPATITVTNEKPNTLSTDENPLAAAGSALNAALAMAQPVQVQMPAGNFIIQQQGAAGEQVMHHIPANFNAAQIIANAPAVLAANPQLNMNSLAQLKIGLENITHGHMIFSSNANQISPEMMMQQQMEHIPAGFVDANGQIAIAKEYYQQQLAQQQNAMAPIPLDGQHVDHTGRILSQQSSTETMQEQLLVVYEFTFSRCAPTINAVLFQISRLSRQEFAAQLAAHALRSDSNSAAATAADGPARRPAVH